MSPFKKPVRKVESYHPKLSAPFTAAGQQLTNRQNNLPIKFLKSNFPGGLPLNVTPRTPREFPKSSLVPPLLNRKNVKAPIKLNLKLLHE